MPKRGLDHLLTFFLSSANKIRLLLAYDERWRDYVERVPKCRFDIRCCWVLQPCVLSVSCIHASFDSPLCSLVEDLSLGMQLGILTFPTKMLPKVRLTAALLSSLKVLFFMPSFSVSIN
jgi:hypothetical protein